MVNVAKFYESITFVKCIKLHLIQNGLPDQIIELHPYLQI